MIWGLAGMKNGGGSHSLYTGDAAKSSRSGTLA